MRDLKLLELLLLLLQLRSRLPARTLAAVFLAIPDGVPDRNFEQSRQS